MWDDVAELWGGFGGVSMVRSSKNLTKKKQKKNNNMNTDEKLEPTQRVNDEADADSQEVIDDLLAERAKLRVKIEQLEATVVEKTDNHVLALETIERIYKGVCEAHRDTVDSMKDENLHLQNVISYRERALHDQGDDKKKLKRKVADLEALLRHTADDLDSARFELGNSEWSLKQVQGQYQDHLNSHLCKLLPIAGHLPVAGTPEVTVKWSEQSQVTPSAPLLRSLETPTGPLKRKVRIEQTVGGKLRQLQRTSELLPSGSKRARDAVLMAAEQAVAEGGSVFSALEQKLAAVKSEPKNEEDQQVRAKNHSLERRAMMQFWLDNASTDQ